MEKITLRDALSLTWTPSVTYARSISLSSREGSSALRKRTSDVKPNAKEGDTPAARVNPPCASFDLIKKKAGNDRAEAEPGDAAPLPPRRVKG